MSIEKNLSERSNTQCELCTSNDGLQVYTVPPHTGNSADDCAHICNICYTQINSPENIDINHWRCLNDSMWSQVPAVQVIAWRMLKHLSTEGWAQDLLEMIYLEEETLSWAEKGTIGSGDTDTVIHKDCNGAQLSSGDTVTLIKDLNVKGAGFTAKRGTAVRNISLVESNAEHIEGRVEGQRIVILTEFVKKSN